MPSTFLPRIFRGARLALACVCLLSGTARAQQENVLLANAIKCFKYGNNEGFLRFSRKLDSIRPSHPTYSYYLAQAYALNGMANDALDALEQRILIDNTISFERDTAFAQVAATTRFAELSALRAQLSETVSHSEKFLTLSEKDLHPESVCFLKKKKLWLASSIRKGKIVSFDKHGVCRDWIKTRYAVFAMKPDAGETFLWVATSGVMQQEGAVRTTGTESEILKIDIKTATVVSRFPLPGSHVIGDLVVARDGTVYATDSSTPLIIRISGGLMQPFASFSGRRFNLQGLTLDQQQRFLYVSDYLSGVVRIDLAQPDNKIWLKFPAGTARSGIDGLCFFDHALYAVQNGVNPIRIVKLSLNADGDEIIASETIDRARPEFDQPTLLYRVDDWFYFISNAPWEHYDNRGNLLAGEIGNPEIFRFRARGHD